MKRTIRLTESEFHNLVRRLVIEAQEEMMLDVEDDMGDEEEFDADFDGPSGKEEDIMKIAQYFKQEVMPELPNRVLQKIGDKVANVDVQKIMNESDEDEYTDLQRRRDKRTGNALLGTGAAVGGTGGLGFLAYIPGYVDFPNSLLKIHELFEQLNLGNYTGPAMAAMVAAGIALAMKGGIKKYEANNGRL
jgi:hypothetical protein